MSIKLNKLLLLSLLMLLVSISVQKNLLAQGFDYDKRVYYFYEVGNQIPLSDFAWGSHEMIRDTDGNGLGFAWVIKKGNRLKLELDLGYSGTVYEGSVEDGVNVTFTPQTGSGYDLLSTSKNVTYDFNLKFSNPYVGFAVVFDYFRFGLGRILQSVTGDVVLHAKDQTGKDFQIATAEYQTKSQLYGEAGFDFSLEGFYIGAYLRAFEAPSLKITSCNETALGSLACDRLKGATGNRNLRSNSFGEGVLHIGWMF